MNLIRRTSEARRRRRELYRNSIHYAIAHAMSESERNELTLLATRQGARL